ncbi:type II secretion system protein [Rhizobacter sp. AJA081-3]|uniref:type II secretion system protein n=1 Tax=Rhizobacter sp. AJA081-3 TaxID=2753607 RepID=UPI001AE0B3DA|nr:type II secretion system protein [Rhizobacter sp. AJA081-3]QTN25671.1 type II secretion system protein [Rhizobacter sp. AJA081-3]
MKQERGFTYLGLLLAIALVGLGLSVASEVWVNVARRQKLEQLEFVGQQFVQAIGSYYESTPGPVKRYPNTLQDLLEDRRNAFVRRHLRQVYVNPFGGDWERIEATEGGLRGIRVRIPSAEGAGVEAREFTYVPGR